MPSGHTSPFTRPKQGKTHPRKNPFLHMPSDSQNRADTDRPILSSVIKSALFALPVTLVCGLLLVSLMAVLAVAQADPASMILPLSLSVVGLCNLIGGLITSRRCGHAPLWCGLVFGALFTLTTWVLSFLFGSRTGNPLSLGLSFPLSMLVRAAGIGLSLLGARLGMHRQGPPRHRRRKS